MFGYDNLFWSVTFPCACAVIMWFSITLALLGRARNGYYRRNRYATSGNVNSSGGGSDNIISSGSSTINGDIVKLSKSCNANYIHTWEQLLDAKLTEIAAEMLEESEPTPMTHFTFPDCLEREYNNLPDKHKTWDEMIDSLLYWRRSRKLILRQAVVVVGGDFARSPRMQYHASSLAKSGLFDEIVLVGLDCNNKLSETLLKSGMASKLQLTASVDFAADNQAKNSNDKKNCVPYGVEVGEGVKKVKFNLHFTHKEMNTDFIHDSNAKSDLAEVKRKLNFGQGEDGKNYFHNNNNTKNEEENEENSVDNNVKVYKQNTTRLFTLGCNISTKYLTPPPQIPRWLAFVFPLKVIYWLARTVYKVMSYIIMFTLLLLRACTLRVNYYGQVKITTLVMMQTPPAHPFIPLMKYVIRPLAFMYNMIAYVGFIIPASWIDAEAMHELRAELNPFISFAHSSSTETFTTYSLSGANGNVDEQGSKEGSIITTNNCGTVNHRNVDLMSILNSSHEGVLEALTIKTDKCSTTHKENKQNNTSHQNKEEITPIQSCLCNSAITIFYPNIVVDWHNFGYSILEAAKRPRWVSNLYKFGEYYGCEGDVNVTVSNAMEQTLHTQVISAKTCTSLCSCNKEAIVLYDVAPGSFHRYEFVEMMHKVIMPMDESSNYNNNNYSKRSNNTFNNTQINNNNNNNGNGSSLESMDISHNTTVTTPTTMTVDTQKELIKNQSVWGLNAPPQWIYERLAKLEQTQHHHKSRLTQSAMSPELYEDLVENDDGLFVIASTSWTEDDDYSMVIAALQRLEIRLLHAQSYREVCSSYSTNTNINTGNETHHFLHSTDVFMGEANNTTSTITTYGNNTSNVTLSGNMASTNRMTPSTSPTNATLSYSANSREERSTHTLPLLKKIWLLITGKGPSLERFHTEVRAANFSSNIVISTVYLQSYADYAFLLGAADVGLCLHFSSCGFDLPMKGVDMIGAALPVIALRYPAIGELMGEPLEITEDNTATKPGTALHQKGNVEQINNENEQIFDKEKHWKEKAIDVENDEGVLCGPVECERGWLFASATELELILAHLIGLDDTAWDVIFDSSYSQVESQQKNNRKLHHLEKRLGNCSPPNKTHANKEGKVLQMTLREARRRALKQRQYACT